MKKKISLILALVMLMTMMFPVNAWAAGHNSGVEINLEGLTANEVVTGSSAKCVQSRGYGSGTTTVNEMTLSKNDVVLGPDDELVAGEVYTLYLDATCTSVCSVNKVFLSVNGNVIEIEDEDIIQFDHSEENKRINVKVNFKFKKPKPTPTPTPEPSKKEEKKEENLHRLQASPRINDYNL